MLSLPGIGPVGLKKITGRWPDPALYDPAGAPPSFGHLANFLPDALPDPVVPPPGVELASGCTTTATRPGLLPFRIRLRCCGCGGRFGPPGTMLACGWALGILTRSLKARRSTPPREQVACALGVVEIWPWVVRRSHEAALEAGGYTEAVLCGELLEPGPQPGASGADPRLRRGVGQRTAARRAGVGQGTGGGVTASSRGCRWRWWSRRPACRAARSTPPGSPLSRSESLSFPGPPTPRGQRGIWPSPTPTVATRRCFRCPVSWRTGSRPASAGGRSGGALRAGSAGGGAAGGSGCGGGRGTD